MYLRYCYDFLVQLMYLQYETKFIVVTNQRIAMIAYRFVGEFYLYNVQERYQLPYLKSSSKRCLAELRKKNVLHLEEQKTVNIIRLNCK